MFRLAICDDDLKVRETLYSLIKETENEVPEQVVIKVYNNGLELYEALQSRTMFA